MNFYPLLVKKCLVELAQTEDDINSMPNGSYVLGIYANNDIESWRDVLFYVSQVLGCFSTINRDGKLELKKYRNTSTLDISINHRFTSSFSDFVTRYSAINSTNNKTKESEYYALDPDDALTMNSESIPFTVRSCTNKKDITYIPKRYLLNKHVLLLFYHW